MNRPNRGLGGGLASRRFYAAAYCLLISIARIEPLGLLGPNLIALTRSLTWSLLISHFVNPHAYSVKRKFGFVQNGGNNLGAPKLSFPGQTSRASAVSLQGPDSSPLKNHQVRRSEFDVPGPVERHDFTVT